MFLHENKKPIPCYLLFSFDVPENFRDYVIKGIRDTKPYVRGLDIVSADDETLSEKILDGCASDGGAILAKTALDILQEDIKTWDGMKPEDAGSVIFVTARDLKVPKMTVCFGLTRVRKRISVISIKRYDELEEEREKELCVRRTIVHEMGHMFGAPALKREIKTADDFGKHCTAKGCVMNQTADLKALREHAEDDFSRRHLFCGRCKRDIKNFLTGRV